MACSLTTEFLTHNTNIVYNIPSVVVTFITMIHNVLPRHNHRLQFFIKYNLTQFIKASSKIQSSHYLTWYIGVIYVIESIP